MRHIFRSYSDPCAKLWLQHALDTWNCHVVFWFVQVVHRKLSVDGLGRIMWVHFNLHPIFLLGLLGWLTHEALMRWSMDNVAAHFPNHHPEISVNVSGSTCFPHLWALSWFGGNSCSFLKTVNSSSQKHVRRCKRTKRNNRIAMSVHFWPTPPPSNSGKWRFQGILYQKK